MSHYDPNIYFLLLGLVVLRRFFYFDLDVTILLFHFSIGKATLVFDVELKGRVGEIEKRKPWKAGRVPWNRVKRAFRQKCQDCSDSTR